MDHQFITAKKVEVVGVSFCGGQPKKGVDMGPQLMLQRGLIDQLKTLGWEVECPQEFPSYESLRPANEDTGKYGHLKNVEFVSNVTKQVHDIVKKSGKSRKFTLTLGGDHSLGIGTVSGTCAAYNNVGVIWVDAHADINTPESTESGNLHGCPVSFLMGIGNKLEPFNWMKPCLDPSRIVYIGLRDVDTAEKRILKDNNILAFSMFHIDKYGIGGVMDMALKHLGDECPIHLSFDVDALDPSVAPATVK